ncbi:beta-galactosidase [Lachnospiraceae bacterium 47-T17]
MIPYEKLEKVPFGGDYNPEQWPREIWAEDMELLRAAHIDIVTLNVFSWAALQPDETTYDFSRLDEIMEMVRENGMKVCFATSTGAHPAWMAKKYPDILRVDFEGRRRKFGGRHNSCPNSPTYRKYAAALTEKLAEHYKDYDNIVAWHISNEFGGECYCENCEKAFRVWLRKKYGTVEAVNRAWDTAFWGHTFYEWDEIAAPDVRSEHFDENRTQFQGISLDYRRFMSDSILECYVREQAAVKSIVPDASVTTNLMGFYKPLDYFKWAKQMDFVSWDNYPSNDMSYARIAMAHDLMRGIGRGAPFALMEQTPSVTNWLPYNSLKRPGVMRLWSYQAMAHGADTVMFFQMRRSIGACEKYHGAVIDHAGSKEARVYREVAALGAELETLGSSTLGMRTSSDIALLMDWDNWWSIEYSAGPSENLRYLNELARFYEALRNMNYNVDIVSPGTELGDYKLVIAPVYYMVKGNDDEMVRSFVKNGGTFVTTFFSGIVEEHDLVTIGGYPGKLRDILGIWVEEEDALPAGMENSFVYRGQTYPATLLCGLLHLEGAQQVDEGGYGCDFYAGMPVITKNDFGKGRAYYLATASNAQFYETFLSDLCAQQGLAPVLETPRGVEVTSRENENGRLIYVLNHKDSETAISLPEAMRDLITGETFEPGGHLLKSREVRIFAPVHRD